ATSKMLHLVAPSLSVVSSASRNTQSTAPNNMDLDVELTTRSRNLSSTLHKLYLWEKKLYNEVKVCYFMSITK
ncbi:BZIP transcription factor BZIP107, partial [Trifolium medium]|nr:BZIP transcription factor BZIP107 [Trifolium medium]